MPITFTEEDFAEPKESSGITFSESDFEEPKPSAEEPIEKEFKKPPIGVAGAFVRGLTKPSAMAALGPSLLALPEETKKDLLLKEYNRTLKETEPSKAAKVSEFIGGIPGSMVPYAAGAMLGRGRPGMMAAGAAIGGAESFLNAGVKALAEGKDIDEALKIANAIGSVSAATGAGTAALFPTGPTSGIAGAAKTGGIIGTAAGASQFLQNLAERELGLQTKPTEGVLKSALMMGLLPPVAHGLGAGARYILPKVLPTRGGVPDARSIEQATEVYGNVRPQPEPGVREVPVQEGQPGVQPQAEPRLQEEAQVQRREVDDLTKKGETADEKAQGKEEAVRETVEQKAPPPEEARSLTLTPVIRAGGRTFIGRTHSDAYNAAREAGAKEGNQQLMVDALDAFSEPHTFLGSDNKIYSRKAGQEILKIQTGKDVLKPDEGLHSTDLINAGLIEHVPETGQELTPPKPPTTEEPRETPTAKAPDTGPVGAEPEPSIRQPSAMAVGIAPPGTAAAQAAIAKSSRIAQGFRTLFNSNPTRKIIDQTFDAADNKANISGQQAGRSLRIGTNRPEREAAMAVVEANGDRTKLDQFEQQVRGKDDRALAAVRYARANWNRLQPLANRVSAKLDEQLQAENANGINTEYHEGYVPHEYDQDLLMGRGRPYVLGGSGGKGISTKFKKGRTFDTIFDAIEQGYKPKSMDVADLVEHRVKVGSKLVNRKNWAEGLKQATDPTDGNPIVADVIRKQRGPGGTTYQVAPPGYSVKEIIPGVKVAWHDGYTSLFDALTGTSRISGSLPGQLALKVAGGIKHGLLFFDTFHASRILQKELFLTGKIGYTKGKTLLEYADQDLHRAVQENEITQEMADWVRQNRPTANLLLDSGLNVGRVQEALYSSFVRQIPVFGSINKWIFEKLTRGAMLQSGLIEFERVKNAMPNLSDKDVALKVSRDLNTYFGNIGHQGWLKSRQMQDLANLVSLAPQWVESMAKTEAYGAAQAVKGLTVDPILHKTIMTGTIGKAVAQGLLAYFVGTQLLNLATRGKPTWDNPEEGHKLDAFIPDVTGKGNGFFMSPFSVVAELTHDMLRYSHKEGTALKAAAKIASNKASPIWRAGRVFLEGVSYNKKRIDDTWARIKASALALAPTPIPLQAAAKVDYPGQAQRQLTASLGLKTEPAESAQQQIMSKSDSFLKSIGKTRPTIEQAADEPSYNNMRQRLRVGDTKGAQEELSKLLKTRTRKQVGQAMQSSITHPFTGSKPDEGKFYKSLSEDEKALYKKAKEERRKEYQKFLEVFRK